MNRAEVTEAPSTERLEFLASASGIPQMCETAQCVCSSLSAGAPTAVGGALFGGRHVEYSALAEYPVLCSLRLSPTEHRPVLAGNAPLFLCRASAFRREAAYDLSWDRSSVGKAVQLSSVLR